MAYDLKVDAGKFGTSRGAAECRRERVGPVRLPIETGEHEIVGFKLPAQQTGVTLLVYTVFTPKF